MTDLEELQPVVKYKAVGNQVFDMRGNQIVVVLASNCSMAAARDMTKTLVQALNAATVRAAAISKGE
jgi:hypothetical protein